VADPSTPPFNLFREGVGELTGRNQNK